MLGKSLLWQRALFPAIGYALCGLAAGCAESGPLLIPVRGTVTLTGRRLTAGYVSYRADAGQGNQTLHIPTGQISAEGRYELFTNGRAGAPPGWYKVLVFADENQRQGAVHPLRPKWLTDEKYTQEETTDLRVEVKTPAAETAYDLQLE